MKGDFTWVGFDALRHFSAVLLQQGRVQLDSDANEESSVLQHYLRSLARDLIGPHGGGPGSFRVALRVEGTSLVDLEIAPGRYYVDGILCESERQELYTSQLDYPLLGVGARLPGRPFLVYLDVWERYVSVAEDDSIRDVALGGDDTPGRARVVWQVQVEELTATGSPPALEAIEPSWCALVECWQPSDCGRLRARTSGGFRGSENRLYRVEVHRGGKPAEATFKWSRDNGSVVAPVVSFQGDVVTLRESGHAELREGDLVEVQSEATALGAAPLPPLLTVAQVDPSALRVTLTGPLGAIGGDLLTGATLLRRWEAERSVSSGWIALEDGIEVECSLSDAGTLRPGDYWQFPARPASGDVVWPHRDGEPEARPPAGVDHHYAPLAVVSSDSTGGLCVADCRLEIRPLAARPDPCRP